MSTHSSAKAFVQELSANSQWQQELAASASTPDALKGWLAAKGCTFPVEDLKAAIEEQQAQGSGSELSEESLAAINGGFYGVIYNVVCKILGKEVEKCDNPEQYIVM